jgi:hypothetical protein
MKTFLSDLSLFAHLIAKILWMTGLGPGIALAIVAEEFPYVYRWAKYLGMPVLNGERKGQPCKVLLRGKRNSCLIEFPDGYQAVTSRNAVRKKVG